MNKKGMYFTLMTIAFILIFLFIFMAPTYKQLSDTMTFVELRVTAINDLIRDVHRDTERGLFISSYRALLALEEHIITSGQFINSTEAAFREAVLNGTVNNQNSSLMIASTFPHWIGKIEAESTTFNVDTNITLHGIDILQNSPWHVTVAVNLSLTIHDRAAAAQWQRTEYITTAIPIETFEDPLYIVYSLGRISHLITPTPYSTNYTSGVNGTWDVTNLLTHVNSSFYEANAQAPSFLMRFENNLSNSTNGIESLVDIKKVSEVGLEVHEDSSIVDYHYWVDVGNGNYRVNFTPSWFKIDNAHRSLYNVTAISYLN